MFRWIRSINRTNSLPILDVPRLILPGMAVIVQRLYYMLFFIVITLLSNVNVYKGFALITILILILKTYLPSLVSNSIARDFYLILSVANSPLYCYV